MSLQENKRKFGQKNGGLDAGESKYFNAIINEKKNPVDLMDIKMSVDKKRYQCADVYKKYKNNNSDFLNS